MAAPPFSGTEIITNGFDPFNPELRRKAFVREFLLGQKLSQMDLILSILNSESFCTGVML
jgi:hypothetical protein